jgi:hypothetical protein
MLLGIEYAALSNHFGCKFYLVYFYVVQSNKNKALPVFLKTRLKKERQENYMVWSVAYIYRLKFISYILINLIVY